MRGLWLGSTRGYLVDWVTQRWVQLTGRRIRRSEHPWLEGLCGETTGIGADFYARVADQRGWRLVEDRPGLMPSFAQLAGAGFDPAAVHPAIADFYERTAGYRLDVWSHWCGAFRPFGWLLAALFSRRLQQLNIPLSPLEASRGLRSRIVGLVDPVDGAVRHTGWVREIKANRRVVYVGDYTVCKPPGHPGPCVKVVFPLPNGSATVVLRPEALPDGSLLLHSTGRRFGDPGFYFVVRDGENAWVRYVPTMREKIHVYVEDGELRTDHVFRVWGLRYLQLHYRLSRAG